MHKQENYPVAKALIHELMLYNSIFPLAGSGLVPHLIQPDKAMTNQEWLCKTNYRVKE